MRVLFSRAFVRLARLLVVLSLLHKLCSGVAVFVFLFLFVFHASTIQYRTHLIRTRNRKESWFRLHFLFEKDCVPH